MARCFMNNETIAGEWQRYAAQDLASAEYLLAMRPQPVEIICYHCQQSAEKYLKAFLALQGAFITKTHDLNALNKSCSNYDASFVEITEACLGLTDYGVQSRYPFQLELSEVDISVAMQNARLIAVFVEARLYAAFKT